MDNIQNTELDVQDFDNMIWDEDDKVSEDAVKTLRKITTCKKLGMLTSRVCGKTAIMKGPLTRGGYNAIYTMELPDSGEQDIVLRLPIWGLVKFPEEKTVAEVFTMKYLKEKTSIPVPKVHHWGLFSHNPRTGPYIIMSRIPHSTSLSDVLSDPLIKLGDPHFLNQFIDEEKLLALYTQMARYLLELSQHQFPRIGSLSGSLDGRQYIVASRPLSININSGIRLAGIPPSILPPCHTTYETSDEWYVELARMHFAQLTFQHNDLVSSADDCRNKYISRLLFYKLAKAGKLSTFGFADDDWSHQSRHLDQGTKKTLLPAPPKTGPFNLWIDDLRAGNVLLDEHEKIASLIDFEFTYSAPCQFSLDPPWWLLLEQPERWADGGLEAWAQIYDRRVKTWIQGMEEVERETGSTANMARYMEQSWEMGRFWVSYAARKSWAFDGVYWGGLDARFWGERKGKGRGRGGWEGRDRWRGRIGLLSTKEREAMERFVEWKLEEGRERVVVNWEPEEARRRLDEVLEGCDEGLGNMLESLNLI